MDGKAKEDEREKDASPTRQRIMIRRCCFVSRSTDKKRQQQQRRYHHAPKRPLPAAGGVMVVLLLRHLSGRRDGHGRAGDRARRRVDDRDGIARALRQRLVQLHVVARLREAGVVGVRQHERGRRLRLLLHGRTLGRAGGERALFGGRRRVDGLKIVLGQEVERAEDLVIIELEALCGLEHPQVVRVCRHLGHLLGTPLRLELPVRILRGDARTSSTPAVVAV